VNIRPDRNMKAQHCLWVAGLSLCFASAAMASTVGGAAPATAWNLLIMLIVLAATVGSIVLNIAAIRQWDRNWGLVSALPILGLVLWSGIILTAKIIDPDSHSLWTLEIFAWAMINMIYMVTAMTAKRMFAKRDEEGSAPY